VGADQVGIVDIGVVDVLAGLHLRLQLLDDVAFADQVMRDLDAGDGVKAGASTFDSYSCVVSVSDTTLMSMPAKRLGGIDEPLHFLFLIGARKRRQIADLPCPETFRGVHIGIGRPHIQQDPRRCRC
jgi:hypothetical protein